MSNIDSHDENLERLKAITKLPIKRIIPGPPINQVEFEDGTVLPLQGSLAQIIDYKEPICSFCGNGTSQVGLLAAPPNKSEPLICSGCAVHFVELFASNGVSINLNLSKISPELAETIAKLAEE